MRRGDFPPVHCYHTPRLERQRGANMHTAPGAGLLGLGHRLRHGVVVKIVCFRFLIYQLELITAPVLVGVL